MTASVLELYILKELNGVLRELARLEAERNRLQRRLKKLRKPRKQP